ncbi:MAG: DUF4358 domain-containing protein [Clostridia bacterium]|nr:DUF4358 domain-containing protein [Clostridia bacterium]
MKKIFFVFLAFALLLCSCTSSFTVNVSEAGAAMADATGYAWMEYDKDSIYNDTGISEDMYVNGFFAWLLEASVGNCACVAVFEAADSTKASEIETYLKAYLTDVQLTQENYNADNYAMTKAAVLFVEGNYVVFAIAPDTSVIKTAFENAKVIG